MRSKPGLTAAQASAAAAAEPPSRGRLRHILLVTRSYPPLNAVSSQRMHQWAKYWSQDGVRVTVLTTKKHWLFGPCDLEAPRFANVEVVEVDFLPAWLIRLLERYRPRRTAAASPSGKEEGRSPGGRLIRAKTWLRRRRLSARFLPAFEFYDLWVGKAVRAGARVIATDPVDVIVSSFGPPAAHKIGARLKRRFPGVLWVADYRDPWTFHDGYERGGLTAHLERRREARLVGRYADLVLSVSRPLAEQSRQYMDVPVMVVENGFDPDEQEEVAETIELPDRIRSLWSPVTLIYMGTLHPEYQDPVPLLRAIADLVRQDDSVRDHLRALFFGERHGQLQRLIDEIGVAEQVRIAGYVDRPTALLVQRQATALLLIENQTSAARGVLRAKLFEYLQAGRPILGIGFGAATEVGRILVEAGAGRICGADVGCIRSSLENLYARGELDGFAPVPAVLRRFRRDVQARALLVAMESRLTERRTVAQSRRTHVAARAKPGSADRVQTDVREPSG